MGDISGRGVGNGGNCDNAEVLVVGLRISWNSFEVGLIVERNVRLSLRRVKLQKKRIIEVTYPSRVPRKPDSVTIWAPLRDGPSDKTMWSFTKSGVTFSCVKADSKGSSNVACAHRT